MIFIAGDVFDTDTIAFVRKLTKPVKPYKGKDAPVHHYVMQLKEPYSFDKAGKVKSLFLSQEEGEALMSKLSACNLTQR